MLIAQITDTHIRADGSLMRGHIDTVAALDAAFAALLALDPRPDLLLMTGDLADEGACADYELLRDRLARLPLPVLLIPGNHDERSAMSRVFGGSPMLPAADESALHYVVDAGAVRLIGLDTVFPGEVWGGLCEARLAWLTARLAEAGEKRTLIFMHHPPFVTGLRFLDLPFPGARELAALIRSNAQVELILCGHMHRAISRRFAGTAAVVAPSTVYQMNLALNPGDRYRPIDDPPAFALSLWEEGEDPISYTVPIGLAGESGGAALR
jgi:3',5'-cyclic AMP phosphodiesterase CpdA